MTDWEELLWPVMSVSPESADLLVEPEEPPSWATTELRCFLLGTGEAGEVNGGTLLSRLWLSTGITISWEEA